MERMFPHNLILINQKNLGSLFHGLCFMFRLCPGFLVQWNHLKKVYHQVDGACRFQLEYAIAMFQHGSVSIQDYYSVFFTLWHEYTDLVTANVLIVALPTIQSLHENSQCGHFLMKLGLEFKPVQSSLLNRSLSYSFS